jgi:hypothetical protein
MSVVDSLRDANPFRYLGFTEADSKIVGDVADKLADELIEQGRGYDVSIGELLDTLNDRLGRGASTEMKAETLSRVVSEIESVIMVLQLLIVRVEIAQWEVERTKQ